MGPLCKNSLRSPVSVHVHNKMQDEDVLTSSKALKILREYYEGSPLFYTSHGKGPKVFKPVLLYHTDSDSTKAKGTLDDISESFRHTSQRPENSQHCLEGANDENGRGVRKTTIDEMSCFSDDSEKKTSQDHLYSSCSVHQGPNITKSEDGFTIPKILNLAIISPVIIENEWPKSAFTCPVPSSFRPFKVHGSITDGSIFKPCSDQFWCPDIDLRITDDQPNPYSTDIYKTGLLNHAYSTNEAHIPNSNVHLLTCQDSNMFFYGSKMSPSISQPSEYTYLSNVQVPLWQSYPIINDPFFLEPARQQRDFELSWKPNSSGVNSRELPGIQLDPFGHRVQQNSLDNNKRFKCGFCNVECSTAIRLKNHQLVRSGEKSHKCECGRAFARKEELTRHKRIHTDHRPFRCEVCDKTFGRNDHLNKHRTTHLQTSQKKVYKCMISSCLQKYTRSDALARHQWTAHGIKARLSKCQTHVNDKIQEMP